ncbi:MAG: hypothetical protein RLZ44_358 [Pseudomonadota bacterium]
MSIRNLILTLLLLAAGWPALAADTYQFEMLVFQRNDDPRGEALASAGDEGAQSRPQASDDLAALAAPRASWRLGPEAYTLNRRGYPTLYHLAWRQAPGNRASNWYRFDAAGAEGLVRLRRGRYLHIDIDLVLANGVHVTTQRRMRSNEIHYLDHPRVGILVRADAYQPGSASGSGSEQEATQDEAPGEAEDVNSGT